jgi:hypothetical protein
MWRFFIPLLVSLVFIGNLFVVGPPSARRFIVGLVGIVGAIGVLSLWAELHREHWLARLLLTERGPGSIGRPWTRQERFRFARLFSLVGVVALALTVLVLSVLVSTQSSAVETVGIYALPFVMFPAGMGLGGGLYMFVRAALIARDSKA